MGGLGPPRAPLRAPNGSGVTSLGLSPSRSLLRMLVGEAQENEGHKTRDEEVGRPTTPPGACPESARTVYRARLITSRGLHHGALQSPIFIRAICMADIGGSIVQVALSNFERGESIDNRGVQIDRDAIINRHGLPSSQSTKQICIAYTLFAICYTRSFFRPVSVLFLFKSIIFHFATFNTCISCNVIIRSL